MLVLWLRLLALRLRVVTVGSSCCHLPFPIRFTSFPDNVHTATRLTSAAFQRGYLRPYLPSYVFLLSFDWQPSLLETSSSHWSIRRPLRFAYSEHLRLHWGFHVPHT